MVTKSRPSTTREALCGYLKLLPELGMPTGGGHYEVAVAI